MNATEHVISVLGEEGAEIAQDCSKCNRFGLDDRNVLDPLGPTNRERLVNELNDLLGTASLLVDMGILPEDWVCANKQLLKKRKIKEFMGYAKNVKALRE
jgi:hypothetical protein